MKKLVLVVLGLLLGTIVNINAVEFEVFRKDSGVLLSRDRADWSGDYDCLPRNITASININNVDKTIEIDSKKYEFMEVPDKWTNWPRYGVVRYECIDTETLEKVFMYLIKYDTTSNLRLLVVRFDNISENNNIEMFSLR